MNNATYIYGLVIFTAIVFCSSSCNNETSSTTKEGNDDVSVTELETIQTTDNTQPQSTLSVNNKEYRSKFICPAHCSSSGSNTTGECRKCGMELIENPNF